MKTYMKEMTCIDYYDISVRLEQLYMNFNIILDSIEIGKISLYKTLSEVSREGCIENLKDELPALHVVLDGIYDLQKECEKAEELQYEK